MQPTEQQSSGGFQWSNILGMLIQMFLGSTSGGIDKADSGVNAAQVYIYLTTRNNT